MEKINIAELLKDCPSGMELDCTMYDNLHFDKVDDYDKKIHCYIQYTDHRTHIMFGKDGTYNSEKASKCVIFPKGRTTWKGFHRPFEDGDILVYKHKSDNVKYTFIYKRRVDMHYLLQYCGWFSEKPYLSEQFNAKERKPLYENDDIKFATEEEKEKLFQAIKDNGYKWNEETKTLEKVNEPKFKVGDVIVNTLGKHIGASGSQGVISEITDDKYIFTDSSYILIKNQDSWELVLDKFDITTLKPFESRVLVRNDKEQYWIPAFWGCKRADGYTTTFGWCKYCIPFEGNEHLLETKDDCSEFFKTWK